jgi:hypothetical protein
LLGTVERYQIWSENGCCCSCFGVGEGSSPHGQYRCDPRSQAHTVTLVAHRVDPASPEPLDETVGDVCEVGANAACTPTRPEARTSK